VISPDTQWGLGEGDGGSELVGEEGGQKKGRSTCIRLKGPLEVLQYNATGRISCLTMDNCCPSLRYEEAFSCGPHLDTINGLKENLLRNLGSTKEGS